MESGHTSFLDYHEQMVSGVTHNGGTRRRPANLVKAAVQGDQSSINYLQKNHPNATIIGEGQNIKVSELGDNN